MKMEKKCRKQSLLSIHFFFPPLEVVTNPLQKCMMIVLSVTVAVNLLTIVRMINLSCPAWFLSKDYVPSPKFGFAVTTDVMNGIKGYLQGLEKLGAY